MQSDVVVKDTHMRVRKLRELVGTIGGRQIPHVGFQTPFFVVMDHKNKFVVNYHKNLKHKK